ncbi:MAG: aminopeptidase [Candidatus Marinimicrobia bacterium]|nr:aminopeptidase [Candidatus Neomarinimicrobiota bacterium]
MQDPRQHELAHLLVNYSTKVQKGENVLIEAFNIPEEFVIELIREVRKKKANPFVSIKNSQILRDLIMNSTEEQMKITGEYEKKRMEKMDCYIGVRGSLNIAENSDIDNKSMDYFKKLWAEPTHTKTRVSKTRWVVLRYPTASMAQQAEMSTEEFENFFYNVCTLDYKKMSKAMNPLMKLIEKTDKVHIKGPGDTDLRFSIKGIPVLKADGHRNIPDGEVFTAPVKKSVNGIIHYNTPSLFQGTVFTDIRFEIKDGKIVKATSSNTKKLNKILDTDKGARYFGEFAFGLNPYINKSMKDTLFDEKINGSIHFTPGNSYDKADNTNKSAIHWDIVLRQKKEFGGGEIYFDDKLIRKNGLFVLKNLEKLNPKNLK